MLSSDCFVIREAITRDVRTTAWKSGQGTSSKTRPEEYSSRSCLRSGHIQQYNRDVDGPQRERHRVVERRGQWLQGISQEHPVRSAGYVGSCSSPGSRARPATSRCLRQGPRLWTRDGDPLLADQWCAGDFDHRHDTNPTQRLPSAKTPARLVGYRAAAPQFHIERGAVFGAFRGFIGQQSDQL